MKTETIPEGTTAIITDQFNGSLSYYKEVGVSKYGYPTFVRWVKSRKSWTKTPEASEHPAKYGVPYSSK